MQGIDYVYTIQDWLKGINGQRLIVAQETGDASVASTPRAPVGRDVRVFSLAISP